MTTPPLEDRLTRLADGLVAPATPEARRPSAVGPACCARRRRTRQAVGAGIVVLAAVAAVARRDAGHDPEAQTDWADGSTSASRLHVDAAGGRSWPPRTA